MPIFIQNWVNLVCHFPKNLESSFFSFPRSINTALNTALFEYCKTDLIISEFQSFTRNSSFYSERKSLHYECLFICHFQTLLLCYDDVLWQENLSMNLMFNFLLLYKGQSVDIHLNQWLCHLNLSTFQGNTYISWYTLWNVHIKIQK